MISAVHFYSYSKKQYVKLVSTKQAGHQLKGKNFIHIQEQFPTSVKVPLSQQFEIL